MEVSFLAKKETFESSLKVLEATVDRLEQGDLSLEEALSCFEEGVKAVKSCQKLLSEAELKIEKLRFDGKSQIASEPFDDQPAGA